MLTSDLIRFSSAAVAAIVLSVLFVGAVRRYTIATSLLDFPGERSSHFHPVPRGGGAGCVAAAILVLLLVEPAFGKDWRLALALAGVIAAAVVGWIDDHHAILVKPRLAMHVLAGLLLLPLAWVSVPAQGPLVALLTVGWVFATVSAINVVNFMDGIDGLIALQGAILGAHLAVVSGGDSTARIFGVILAASASGFLVWNWAPARIFLGDVGSSALGVLGLIGGLLVLRSGSARFLTVFLPLFPIFLDATVTIIRRKRRGEPLTVAHRTHLYQRLANGGWGHARVSTLYGAAALVGSITAILVPEEFVLLAAMLYAVAVFFAGWVLERVAITGVTAAVSQPARRS